MYVFTLLRRRCDCEGRYCRSSHSGTVVLLTQVLLFSLRYCCSFHSPRSEALWSWRVPTMTCFPFPRCLTSSLWRDRGFMQGSQKRGSTDWDGAGPWDRKRGGASGYRQPLKGSLHPNASRFFDRSPSWKRHINCSYDSVAKLNRSPEVTDLA